MRRLVGSLMLKLFCFFVHVVMGLQGHMEVSILPEPRPQARWCPWDGPGFGGDSLGLCGMPTLPMQLHMQTGLGSEAEAAAVKACMHMTQVICPRTGFQGGGS